MKPLKPDLDSSSKCNLTLQLEILSSIWVMLLAFRLWPDTTDTTSPQWDLLEKCEPSHLRMCILIINLNYLQRETQNKQGADSHEKRKHAHQLRNPWWRHRVQKYPCEAAKSHSPRVRQLFFIYCGQDSTWECKHLTVNVTWSDGMRQVAFKRQV